MQTSGALPGWQRAVVLGALLTGLGVWALTAPVGARARSGHIDTRGFTLYARAEQEQYVNNQDDRTRGKGNNPFGNFRDTSGSQTKSPNGPFPGDESIFSFNLYSDSDLTSRAGTAVFVCQYNYDKNAFCDASFRLATGETLLAEGSFAFSAPKFTLAVTGGVRRIQEPGEGDGERGAKPAPCSEARLPSCVVASCDSVPRWPSPGSPRPLARLHMHTLRRQHGRSTSTAC